LLLHGLQLGSHGNEAEIASAMQQEEQHCHVIESMLGSVRIEG